MLRDVLSMDLSGVMFEDYGELVEVIEVVCKFMSV